MILKAGTYKFNDVLGLYDFTNADIDGDDYYYYEFTFPFTFTLSLGEEIITYECTELKLSQDTNEPNTINMCYYSYNAFANYVYKNGVWGVDGVELPNENIEQLKTITIPENTEVDDTFGAWYIANTNYNEDIKPSLAEITYNGETIAELNAGETVILKCEGLPMVTDIIVKVNG